jgi:hypothetical protein
MLASGLMMNLLFGALVLLAIAVVVIGVIRIATRVARRAARVGRDLEQRLAELRPGVAPLRTEPTAGDRSNAPPAAGHGALALFADELMFVRPAGPPFRLPLGEVTDVTEVRAVASFGLAEQALDAPSDYALRVSWSGGAATFMVTDASDWIEALARARP